MKNIKQLLLFLIILELRFLNDLFADFDEYNKE